jgi:capsular exopolysaccharide synthesis family protein
MDARSASARPLSALEAAHRPLLEWRRQLFLFRRRRSLFLIVVALGLLLTAAAVLVLPVRYVAGAEVVIEPRREQALDLRQSPSAAPADNAAIDTEVELLKSRALVERVVETLGLEKDAEFEPTLRPTFSRVLAGAWSSPKNRAQAVVNRVQRRLKVARIGFTAVIAVSFASRSPEKAASIANVFTTLYLQQQLDAKSDASRRTADLLNARLGGLRAEVDAAEHAVERYKAAHGLMTLTDSQGATSTEQEVSNLDGQLATARGARAEAEARLSAALAQTADGRPGDDVGEVLSSPVVQELRKQRDEVGKQIAELDGRYGPRHPDLLKAQRQRTELDAEITQEIGRVVSNLKAQVEVARSRYAAIASAVAGAKSEQAKINNASVELRGLQQNLDAVRTLYQAFLDRSKQTLAQDGMAQADARLVAPAKAPTAPAFPDRLLLLGAGLTASLLGGLLALWIAEAREDGLYAPEDLERRLGLPCLGLIPAIEKLSGDKAGGPMALVLTQPFSAFAETFRTLKAGLSLAAASGPVRTIAVVSALPEEGKTTTCMCLGRIVARSGSPTVVVDCDLRRQAMSRLLAAPPRAGLLDVLSGRASIEDALVQDEAPGLWLLPIGDDAKGDEDVFQSVATTELLDALKRRFRVVILDTAPVLLVAETAALAAKADAVLLLARWGKTPADAAAGAIKRLESGGAYLAGAALTKVDLRHVDSRAYPYAADYYPFYPAKADHAPTLLARFRRRARK